MRTIKFRAKGIKYGKWVYGDYVSPQASGAPPMIYDPERGYPVEVDPETVGQYTGRADSDGHDIYEDDVLSCVYPDGGVPKRTGDVFWDEKFAQWCIHDDGEGWDNLTSWVGYENFYDKRARRVAEIIGNRHDNPSLLTPEPTHADK